MAKKEYRYDPGENRFKHRWKRDDAGFVLHEGMIIGKCPCSITQTLTENLLNNKLPEEESAFIVEGELVQGIPRAIFAFYKGVLYKLVPTQPGISFHGYPICNEREIPPKKLKEPEAISLDKDLFRLALKDWIGKGNTICKQLKK